MAKSKSLSKQSHSPPQTSQLTQSELELLVRAEMDAATQMTRPVDSHIKALHVISIRVKIGELQVEEYFNSKLTHNDQ